MSNPLTLYGVPFSQPVRAVMWLLLYKRMPFEMVLINPGSRGDNGSRSPEFLAKNPGGTIPCIEEADGFVLAGLGDISEQAPDIDRIRSANKRALSTLKARLAELR